MKAFRVNFVIAVLFAAVSVCNAADEKQEGQYQHVFVFDSTTKPSVAVSNGRYEWRKVTHPMKCDACMKEVEGSKTGTKPTAAVASTKECIAYLCAHCSTMVWNVEGKEVHIAEQKEALSEADVKAIVKITRELSKPFDGTTKPAAQTLQKMENN